MKRTTDVADDKDRRAEIWQVSEGRRAATGFICKMPPAQFLFTATCSLLNNDEGL